MLGDAPPLAGPRSHSAGSRCVGSRTRLVSTPMPLPRACRRPNSTGPAVATGSLRSPPRDACASLVAFGLRLWMLAAGPAVLDGTPIDARSRR